MIPLSVSPTLPHFRGIWPIIYSSIRDDLTKSEATRGFVSSRYVDCRCFRCNAGRWGPPGSTADLGSRGQASGGPPGVCPASHATQNTNAVLIGNRQGQGKGVRKRKVAPPEAAAAPEAAESSASEEEDSSVSDDFQP